MMQPAQVNPYTRAIKNALEQIGSQGDLDQSKSQFLANMIQGRFLQYMVSRVTDHYRILDAELTKGMTMVFTNLLRNKFFNVFREIVESNPGVLLKIARKIVEYEDKRKLQGKRLEGLFIWLGNRYFGYHNFEIIFQWVNRNREVQKIIFLAKAQEEIEDESCLRTLRYILDEDLEGVVPLVFNRYLYKGRIERMTRLIESGDWRLEAELVENDLAKRIAWERFVARF